MIVIKKQDISSGSVVTNVLDSICYLHGGKSEFEKVPVTLLQSYLNIRGLADTIVIKSVSFDKANKMHKKSLRVSKASWELQGSNL